jgi:Aminotransferase class I and II
MLALVKKSSAGAYYRTNSAFFVTSSRSSSIRPVSSSALKGVVQERTDPATKNATTLGRSVVFNNNKIYIHKADDPYNRFFHASSSILSKSSSSPQPVAANAAADNNDEDGADADTDTMLMMDDADHMPQKVESALTDLQKALWNSYLATGRGADALFRSMDVDGDDKLSPSDVHFFLVHALRHSEPGDQNTTTTTTTTTLSQAAAAAAMAAATSAAQATSSVADGSSISSNATTTAAWAAAAASAAAAAAASASSFSSSTQSSSSSSSSISIVSLPKAFRWIEERAHDHPIELGEFKNWLVSATQERGYVSIQPSYEKSPTIGARSPPKKMKKQQQQQQQKQSQQQQQQQQQQQDEHQQDDHHYWNETTMNQGLRRMQYAVRGDVVIRADTLAQQGREIIFANIGNPHAVGQTPITYYRQVMALCDLPAECGVDHPAASLLFPADALQRARHLRDTVVGAAGTGAYTNSQGLAGVRQDVADFIAQRDGGHHPAYPGDIYLTNGASAGIEMCLNALIAHDTDAVLIPIPQYPIYSALITRMGGRKLGYELDESLGWAVSRQELDKRLVEAKNKGLTIKALVRTLTLCK